VVTLTTTVEVDGMNGSEVFDFLANPDDESYRAWWPGTHLALHVEERGEGHVGDVVHMDEFIGRRRLRMTGVVTEAVPGRRLVWQLAKGIRLPARVRLDLTDDDRGVTITHTTQAGFRGVGRVFDPVLERFLSRWLGDDLDDHVRTEFPRLRDLLHERRCAAEPARHAGPT
jgi:uncharacterized protein YndB with AHSA1/START domain